MTIVHVMKMTGVAGAENHLLLLTAGLRARGLQAQVVMLVEPGNPVQAFRDAAAVESIPTHPLVIQADVDPTLLPRLRRTLRMMRPCVVHTHLLHADVYGIPAARLAGVPVVVTSRHNDNAFRRRSAFRQLNRALWAGVDAGVAISESIRRFAVEVEGAPPAKMRTIPYGIALERLQPTDLAALRDSVRAELEAAPDELLVGMACRLVEQKGVQYGIRAFASLRDRFAARLVIAGDGPLRAGLEAEARACGVANRARFLGWRDDVPRLLAGFDVLLMPSLWEGFGLVILEAMSRRVPVIASRVSAIPEIVADGETGLLVPPRDADALAAALALLLSDYALRRHMGLLAEDRLETHFSAGRMVSQTVALYKELLQRRSKRL
ncbi:MAG: glycosyltransferase [Aggregatilineales bacterium]